MIYKINDRTIIATSDKTEVVIAKDFGSSSEFNWYTFGPLHSNGFSIPEEQIQHLIDILEEIKNAKQI